MVENVQMSFCITCRNRLWQLSQTLHYNLLKLDDFCEIILVDFGSSDGLSEFIWGNFSKWIHDRKLIYFEVSNPVNWHMAKAKNLSHRLSKGSYIFNLDADNFIGSHDIERLRLYNKMSLPTHQWSGIWGDGTCGRIGLPRVLFNKLGGYDESLLPTGGDDIDLLNRIKFLGMSVIKLPCDMPSPIQNDMPTKIQEFDSKKRDANACFNTMNQFNLKISSLKLNLEGACRSGFWATYKGFLNGKPVMIDGFNNITYINSC